MISKEMIKQLISHGLTKQQAESSTATKIIDYLMKEDDKMLIHEAENQVAEMKLAVYEAKQEYSEIMQKINDVAGILIDVEKAQKEFGTITDEKAKNTIALYASLIRAGTCAGATADDAVTNAGYVTYAYLGGQARRTNAYNKSENNKILFGVGDDD